MWVREEAVHKLDDKTKGGLTLTWFSARSFEGKNDISVGCMVRGQPLSRPNFMFGRVIHGAARKGVPSVCVRRGRTEGSGTPATGHQPGAQHNGVCN